MDFTISPEDQAFRMAVRQFFKDNLPRDMQHRMALGYFPPDEVDRKAFHKILHKKGWSAPHWALRFAQLDIELHALRYLDGDINPEAELASLMWPDYVPGRIHASLHSRAYTIYGGSMQVQKGIIAKAASGL